MAGQSPVESQLREQACPSHTALRSGRPEAEQLLGPLCRSQAPQSGVLATRLAKFHCVAEMAAPEQLTSSPT